MSKWALGRGKAGVGVNDRDGSAEENVLKRDIGDLRLMRSIIP
jgi:hypothetical protein